MLFNDGKKKKIGGATYTDRYGLNKSPLTASLGS